MGDSRLVLVYQDWTVFGQPPSRNNHFNLMVRWEQILQTPYIADGVYSNYYCLLDRSMTNAKPRF